MADIETLYTDYEDDRVTVADGATNGMRLLYADRQGVYVPADRIPSIRAALNGQPTPAEATARADALREAAEAAALLGSAWTIFAGWLIHRATNPEEAAQLRAEDADIRTWAEAERAAIEQPRTWADPAPAADAEPVPCQTCGSPYPNDHAPGCPISWSHAVPAPRPAAG